MGLTGTQIMAKLEDAEGLANYRDIIEVADSIIFSRGNLGICLDPEKMFLVQKALLRVRGGLHCSCILRACCRHCLGLTLDLC